MKVLIRIVVLGFVLLIIAYVGASIYIANALTTIAPNPLTEPATVIAQTYEDVVFQTPDNATLKGWLFLNTQSDKLIILVAGHGQNRLNPEYGSVAIAKELLAQGYSVLMYDGRGKGESQKARAGFGFGTGNDILGAVGFAQTKGFTPDRTGIIANSMGATATVLFSDKLATVGSLVVDSPAAELEPIISSAFAREKSFVPSFLYPGIYFFSKTFFGVDIPGAKPITTLAQVPNRIFLFLHGEQDVTIPVANSQQLLAKANPQSQLVVFPNAVHVATYKTDPARYRTVVFDFLTAQLP